VLANDFLHNSEMPIFRGLNSWDGICYLLNMLTLKDFLCAFPMIRWRQVLCRESAGWATSFGRALGVLVRRRYFTSLGQRPAGGEWTPDFLPEPGERGANR
jgi:hypothetical protein